MKLASDDIQLVICSAKDANEWDTFVNRSSGNYCHAYAWRDIINKTYRLKTLYLSFRRGNDWIGILPLVIMPRITPLSKLYAVSLPYCNYGGFLVADGTSKDIICQRALSFLRENGINKLELREQSTPGESISSAEVTLILNLPESVELLWKQIGDKVRNQVRKAERSGLEVRWGHNQATDLYDIYADNMGRLGTPVHSRTFVDNILEFFGEHADVLTVRLDGGAIAAMLVLKYGNTWVDPLASSRQEFNHLNPNMLLYWEALRQATIAEVKHFDFGRSNKASGTYRFKKQWGAIDVPLDYYTYVDGIRLASASTNIYRGDKAAMFAKAWSKLPRSCHRYLGPTIRRHIP